MTDISQQNKCQHKDLDNPAQQQSSSQVQDQDDTLPYPVTLRSTTSRPAVKEDCQISSNPQQLSGVHLQNQRLLEAISLNNVEVVRFNGDPLRYFEFIRSFDNLIGSSSLDDGSTLLKLYHCC